MTFEEGRNPDVEFMAHLWEPLRWMHKPLTVYIFAECVWLGTDCLLRALGFRAYKHHNVRASERLLSLVRLPHHALLRHTMQLTSRGTALVFSQAYSSCSRRPAQPPQASRQGVERVAFINICIRVRRESCKAIADVLLAL